MHRSSRYLSHADECVDGIGEVDWHISLVRGSVTPAVLVADWLLSADITNEVPVLRQSLWYCARAGAGWAVSALRRA